MTTAGVETNRSPVPRWLRELSKLLGAVVLLAVAIAVFVNANVTGFDGPVDPARLEASGRSLRAVRPDIEHLPTPTGTADHGVDLDGGCRLGDSVAIGPSVSRAWAATDTVDLAAAQHQVVAGLAVAGWTKIGSPSETVTRLAKTTRGRRLVAEVETHDDVGQERDVVVSVYVDGPDGCTA